MDKLEKKYPEIYRRYKRKVMAHPEGVITHEGDCGLFNAYLGVCTCGLHHILLPITNGDIEKIYSKFLEEQKGQGIVEVLLNDLEHVGLWVRCKACKGTGDGNRDIFSPVCKGCEGKGFVSWKMLDPVPEAEIDKMFREAGWKPKAEVEKENNKRKENNNGS